LIPAPLLHWCLRAGADAQDVGMGYLYSVVVCGVLPWLLKYNFYKTLHHKGRNANLTKSFAIFACRQDVILGT
jgi:hypothetical protein